MLSRTGTIGRVNSYSDIHNLFEFDALKMVASSQMVVVRPNEGTSPAFLTSLIASPAYQEWLTAHATGSTVQQLRLKDLAELPVLQAPKHIQSAVAEHLLAGHPMEAMATMLSRGVRQDASLLAFIEKQGFCDFLEAHEKGEGTDALRTLADTLEEPAPVGLLQDWWKRIHGLVRELMEALVVSRLP